MAGAYQGKLICKGIIYRDALLLFERYGVISFLGISLVSEAYIWIVEISSNSPHTR